MPRKLSCSCNRPDCHTCHNRNYWRARYSLNDKLRGEAVGLQAAISREEWRRTWAAEVKDPRFDELDALIAKADAR